MRAAVAMSVMLTLLGCVGEPPSHQTKSRVQTPDDSNRADDHESSDAAPVRRVFGVASNFSGKLTEEEEKAVPESLHGAFYIEALRQITTTDLETELKLKTLVAEENHDGNRYVALKDFRCVQFSDEVSGQMIVIERYLVTPN